MQSQPDKDKIWIVGCGDIGRRVAALQQNREILGIVRSAESASACQSLGIKVYRSDFDQKISLPKEIPNKVYYFMPPPAEGRDDPRLKGFLDKVGKHVKRIILISTTGVYGDSKGEWIDENTPVRPVADRAHRRLSAEQSLKSWAAKTAGEYLILRVPGIYALERLPLARLKKGLPLVKADEAGWTNRIHADDLAQACKAAMESPHHNEVINICDGNPSSMTDYFNQIADFAHLPRPPQISLKEAEKTLSKGMVSYLKESRRISNKKMRNLLNIKLQYADLSEFFKICKK